MKKKLTDAPARPEDSLHGAEVEAQANADAKKIMGVPAASSSRLSTSGRLSEGVRLTKREIEVLRLMAVGLQNKEIAAVLSIAEGTVKIHVHNILSKLEVSSRTRAIARVFSGFLF